MDGLPIWVVVADNDDDIDAQVFQTERDAELFVIQWVKEVIELQEIDEFTEDDGTTGSWSLWISDVYERAIDFLNWNDVQDYGVMIVKRHLHPKESE